MTLDRKQDNTMEQLFNIRSSQEPDRMKSLLQLLFNSLMEIERSQAIRANPYQRTEERQGYANGFKDKTLKTRMGALELKVPQTRGLDFYPACLEKGIRSEKALKVALAEMYLKGVSTRKVKAVTEKLCGLEISSSQVSALTKELDEELKAFRERSLGKFCYIYFDAIYQKVRHNGIVMSLPVLISYGVNKEGQREVLGVSMSFSEAETHWRTFMESLQSRGLSGVELVISDNHAGLKNALTTVFPSVPWQRCQFHLAQNAQHHAPKKDLKGKISAAMREVFHAPTKRAAEQAKKDIRERFEKVAPEFVSWFDENIDEGLTCLNFRSDHRKKIRTVNGLERVNREIRRRTRVAVLFPNCASALRLVTAVLVEIHDDWITGKNYLNMKEPQDT